MENQNDQELELEQIPSPEPVDQPVQEPELEDLDLEAIIREFREPEQEQPQPEDVPAEEPEAKEE